MSAHDNGDAAMAKALAKAGALMLLIGAALAATVELAVNTLKP